MLFILGVYPFPSTEKKRSAAGLDAQTTVTLAHFQSSGGVFLMNKLKDKDG